MRTVLRVAALFAAYSAVGFGGDYAVGLLLAQDDVEVRHVREIVVDVQPEVVVDVQPEVVVDVRVSQVRVRNNGQCSFSVERGLVIEGDGVSLLNIDAGSGELRVEGRQGLDEIQVSGLACASHQEYLDELRLTIDEGPGGEITLSAHYPERRDLFSGGDNTAKIDLEVLIPLGLGVDIDDSSGGMEVSGTGDLRIDDSSGSIQVSGINGSVSIDDSSGGVELSDVSGDVEIEDGSGGLDLRDIQGSLHLRDGSGGIDIAEVGQDVLIESDGSGGIEVRGVGGDFVVERDGSGGIRHSDVGGRVDIPVDRRRRRGGD